MGLGTPFYLFSFLIYGVFFIQGWQVVVEVSLVGSGQGRVDTPCSSDLCLVFIWFIAYFYSVPLLIFLVLLLFLLIVAVLYLPFVWCVPRLGQGNSVWCLSFIPCCYSVG